MGQPHERVATVATRNGGVLLYTATGCSGIIARQLFRGLQGVTTLHRTNTPPSLGSGESELYFRLHRQAVLRGRDNRLSAAAPHRAVPPCSKGPGVGHVSAPRTSRERVSFAERSPSLAPGPDRLEDRPAGLEARVQALLAASGQALGGR